MRNSKPPMNKQIAKSLPLIEFQEGEGFKINSEAINFLASIPNSKKCHIVSIAGKVKTGKSYLINKLLNIQFRNKSNEKDIAYFEVAHHLNRCTQGINILNKWVDIGDGAVIFLDTEGLGNLQNSFDHDCKFFALILLISSTLIYNNVGAIDEQALQNLSLIVEMGKLFQKFIIEQDKQALGIPSLMMVLRDFCLKIQNKNGVKLSQQQYLQQILQEQKGFSHQAQQKNRIRRVIKQIFKERNCETLIMPSQELPITFSSSVREQFYENLYRLNDKLFSQIKSHPKIINNKSLNGSQYVTCLQEYVKYFNSNSNSLPRLENLPFQIYKAQINKIKQTWKNFVLTLFKKQQKFQQNFKQKIEISLQLGQLDLGDPAHEIFELQKSLDNSRLLMAQISESYNKACQEISSLLFRQNNNGSYQNGEIQFSKLDSIGVRQFKDIEEFKQEKVGLIRESIIQLENRISQVQEQIKEKKMSHKEESQFNYILDNLALVETEQYLETQYFQNLQFMKKKTEKINSVLFQKNILKLEVVFLKRKMELRERETCLNCRNNGINAKQSKSPLKQIRHNNADKLQKYSSCFFSSSKGNPEQILNNNLNIIKVEKTENRSFYIPYVVIKSCSCINIQIIKTMIKEDCKKKNYAEYVLEVVLNHKRWTFNRKWKDFCELNNILQSMFPNHQMPSSSAFIVDKSLKPCHYLLNSENGKDSSYFPYHKNQSSQIFKEQQIEDKRKQLQLYVRSLIKIQFVRNSRIMQKFLKINKEYITSV